MLFRLIGLLAFFHISTVYADARLIIHLTDYLANDYSGAVSEEGKILSEVEYAEQVEFSLTAYKEATNYPALKDNAEIVKSLTTLKELIAKKTAPSIVIPMARDIQKKVIQVSGIDLSPAAWPDYDKAQALFKSNCVSCHGVDGKGDGPDGVGLDPKPANFHDLERAPIVSPFAAFNTIRLGVPGTGMPGFSDFSDEEIWSLAFYVNTFRFGRPAKSRDVLSSKVSNEIILTKAAELNDHALSDYLKSVDGRPDFLSKVRLYFFESQASDFLLKTEQSLDQSVKQFHLGNYPAAEKLSIEAYFNGIEPLENKISANDPTAVTRIEEQMAGFRKAIKEKNPTDIRKFHQALKDELGKINLLLSGQTVTPALAFLSGFSIILREGFEAVLVILAILGVGKAAANGAVMTAIHSGWIVSLILGVIGWFISGWLISISGVSREIMEALAAFFAVFVLIYVGFWMHRQTEISRWKEFINVRVKNLTQTKNLIGLFALSFLVTFREVIETVLFLRTVYLDTGLDAQIYILVGVIVAFIIVMVVSIMITKYRNKISLQKFFTISSVLMMILATILVGKGIHALQEAGIASMTIFPLKLRVELLGVFPSWETYIGQIAILATSVLIWKKAGKKN